MTKLETFFVFLYMRYFIELSYKGTDFKGWQRQPNAISVEETLEKALSTLLRQPVQIVGSSRTDSGVHAVQQFAHFDLDVEIPNIDRLVHCANGILPRTIVVIAIFKVKDEVHSRFAATHRAYEYRIATRKSPFLTDLVYFFNPKLDVNLMNAAAQILFQYIDYECFCKLHTDVKTFNCKITEAQWTQQGDLLVFRIKSDRFLRGMVRAIVGTMIDVGTGKISIADFENIIVSKKRANASAQAPAEGLFLVEVGYEYVDLVL
jgi:tRNA pseudouridine38-40 synthase